jgi:hypothetical protein
VPPKVVLECGAGRSRSLPLALAHVHRSNLAWNENDFHLRLLPARNGQQFGGGLASISTAPAATSNLCRTKIETCARFAGARFRL